MLSGSATKAVSLFRALPNSVVCVTCLAAYLGVPRSAALKNVRELIKAGRILCTCAGCGICGEWTPVAYLRRRSVQPPAGWWY